MIGYAIQAGLVQPWKPTVQHETWSPGVVEIQIWPALDMDHNTFGSSKWALYGPVRVTLYDRAYFEREGAEVNEGFFTIPTELNVTPPLLLTPEVVSWARQMDYVSNNFPYYPYLRWHVNLHRALLRWIRRYKRQKRKRIATLLLCIRHLPIDIEQLIVTRYLLVETRI